jgi:hypothetical protein
MKSRAQCARVVLGVTYIWKNRSILQIREYNQCENRRHERPDLDVQIERAIRVRRGEGRRS